MSNFQQTIKQSISVSGTGIHSGKFVTLTLFPAEEDKGIYFRRSDIENTPTFKADVDLVVDVERGTTLEYNGIKIATVEHLLAALVGLEIDNVIIDLDGEEVPILDGSAQLFVDLIEKSRNNSTIQSKRIFCFR